MLARMLARIIQNPNLFRIIHYFLWRECWRECWRESWRERDFSPIGIGIRRPWIVLFAAVDDDRSHLIPEVSEGMGVFWRDI